MDAPKLVKSELIWWQHQEGTDDVRANVLHTFDVGEKKTITTGQDLEPPLSDKAMQEHAQSIGKTAWDNDDVAAFAGAQLGVTVTRREPPAEDADKLLGKA